MLPERDFWMTYRLFRTKQEDVNTRMATSHQDFVAGCLKNQRKFNRSSPPQIFQPHV